MNHVTICTFIHITFIIVSNNKQVDIIFIGGVNLSLLCFNDQFDSIYKKRNSSTFTNLNPVKLLDNVQTTTRSEPFVYR